MDSHPTPPGPATPRRGYFTIFLALLACGVAAGMLVVLPLLGYIGLAILVVGLMFCGIVGLHYIVWGKWLNQIVQQEQAEEQDA